MIVDFNIKRWSFRQKNAQAAAEEVLSARDAEMDRQYGCVALGPLMILWAS